MEMEREMDHLRQENTELKMKLNSKSKSTDALEKRIKHLQQQKDMMVKEQQLYEHDKRELEHEVWVITHLWF